MEAAAETQEADPGCPCNEKDRGPEANTKGEDVAPVAIDLGASPARGRADAPVTIVIFSDFECPFCNKVLPTLDALDKKFPNKIRFVFKNNPLPFHEHADLAARAALAAHRQGKFWEMHNEMFENQDSLDRPGLLSLATKIGLDTEALERDLKDPKIAAEIEADRAQASRIGVQGTPSFFVNGRILVGAQPLPAFEKAVKRALGG